MRYWFWLVVGCGGDSTFIEKNETLFEGDEAGECSDDAEVEQASYQTTSVYGFGHPPYYTNMLDALQGKAKPLCDGREGLRSLELLTAAYRSARDGRRVCLPLEY